MENELYQKIAPLLTLPLARFTIWFEAERDWRIDDREADFRGKLGWRLKHALCVYTHFQDQPCSYCPRYENCGYPFLFEPLAHRRISGGGENAVRKTSIPPPFVFSFSGNGTELIAGEQAALHIHLIGDRAADYAAFFMEAAAFSIAAYPRRVQHIAHERPPGAAAVGGPVAWPLKTWIDSMMEPTSDRLALRFVTPVRLARNGELMKKGVDFSMIVQAAVRRLRDLVKNYGSGADMGATDRDFYRATDAVTVAADRLEWKERRRRSSRQRQSVYLNGLEGKIAFKGPVRPFTSLLRAAEMVHIGKATSSGNGRIEII